MLVKYKELAEVFSSYRNKEPISLVATQDGPFYAIGIQSENNNHIFGIQVGGKPIQL